MKVELAWLHVSGCPTRQSDSQWALQNVCGMSSEFYLNHAHHVGEVGLDLSIIV